MNSQNTKKLSDLALPERFATTVLLELAIIQARVDGIADFVISDYAIQLKRAKGLAGKEARAEAIQMFDKKVNERTRKNAAQLRKASGL